MTEKLAFPRIENIGVPVRVSPYESNRYSLYPSAGEYPCYDKFSYDSLAIPSSRNRAYLQALEKLAPGKVALDIGTGRDALWAVAAVMAGANLSYAIEVLKEVAEGAAETVRKAGMTDTVTVVHGDSRQVSLPEKAQLCVSEIIGCIASSEGMIGYLNDAKRRLCRTDCTWIPYQCETVIAAASMPRSLFAGGYSIADESLFRTSQIFAQAGRPFDLRICVGGPAHEAVISTDAVVEDLILGNSIDDNQACDVTLTIDREDALLTGFFLWPRIRCLHDGPVVDGIRQPDAGWPPVYVPGPADGIPCRTGDQVDVRFARHLSDDGVHPDYLVQAVIRRRSGPQAAIIWQSDHHGRRFRCGEFYRELFPAQAAAAAALL